MNNIVRYIMAFITPIVFLHKEETYLPITPEQYLQTVALWRNNTKMEDIVTLDTLATYANDINADLRSKYNDPKQFWKEYKYDDITSIPMYYTERKCSLQYPDSTQHEYIERT